MYYCSRECLKSRYKKHTKYHSAFHEEQCTCQSSCEECDVDIIVRRKILLKDLNKIRDKISMGELYY